MPQSPRIRANSLLHELHVFPPEAVLKATQVLCGKGGSSQPPGQWDRAAPADGSGQNPETRIHSAPLLQKTRGSEDEATHLQTRCCRLSPEPCLNPVPLCPHTAPRVHPNVPVCLFFFHLVVAYFLFKQSRPVWVADRSWECHKDKKR